MRSGPRFRNTVLLRYLTLGLGCLVWSACAAAPASLLPEPVAWQPLGWLSASVDTIPLPRAALMLRETRPTPVPRLYQLDFAGNGQRPAGFPEPAKGSACPDSAPKIAGLLAESRTAGYRIGFSRDTLAADSAQIGTLGLVSVALGVAALDAARNRFAVVPALSAVAEDRRRVRWTRVEVVDDRLVATLQLPQGGGTSRALLDTGLLPIPALVRQDLWRRWTGREPNDPRNRRLALRLCGADVTVALAPSTVRLRLGEEPLELPQLGVLLNAPPERAVEAWPEQVDLMLGAQAWLGRRMVLLDVRLARVGVVRR